MLRYTQIKQHNVLNLPENNSMRKGGGDGGIDEIRLPKCLQ